MRLGPDGALESTGQQLRCPRCSVRGLVGHVAMIELESGRPQFPERPLIVGWWARCLSCRNLWHPQTWRVPEGIRYSPSRTALAQALVGRPGGL